MRRATKPGSLLDGEDGEVLEMVSPSSGSPILRFQYRKSATGGLESRTLRGDGRPMIDGSPWRERSAMELSAIRAERGAHHPILDPLGL